MQQPLSKENQDARPLSILYQEHAPQVFTYLRLHLRSKEDAEDLLVEIFLACLESPAFQRLVLQRDFLW